MTRRRPPRVFTERLVGAVESMTPGTVGGRVSNASPVPPAAHAVSRGTLGTSLEAQSSKDEIGLPSEDYDPDIFTISGAGDLDHTLTYPPKWLSSVTLNGLGLSYGNDFTLDWTTKVLSLLDAPAAGDVLEVWYVTTGELIAGVLPVVAGPGVFVNGAGNGNTGSTATVSMPSGLAAGDLLIAAIMLRFATPTTPSGWTHEGNDSNLAVYSKISDGTETGVTFTGFGTAGWAAELQIYRGTNIRVASSAFGPSASTSTTCDLPSASVTGEPLAVQIWGGTHTFSGAVNLAVPGTTSNVTTGTEPGRQIKAGSEALSGVSTTPVRQATGTVDDVWGAAVLTVAIDE